MALPTNLLESFGTRTSNPTRAALLLAVVVVLLLAATAIFGVQLGGPTYELTSDPAGMTLPF